MIETVFGDKERVWKIKKRRHTDSDQFLRRMFRSERSQQDLDGGWIGLRQMRRKRARDVFPAIQQLEIVEPGSTPA